MSIEAEVASTQKLPPPMPELMGDTLEEQFIVAPFTVLDARKWSQRRLVWKDCLGLARGFGGEVVSATTGEGELQSTGFARARGGVDRVRGGDSAAGLPHVKARKVGTGGAPPPVPGTGDRAGQRDQGGSSFDPVTAEIDYRWFCPPGGQILDPFAGSCVRGMVAAWRGYHYLGNDLRAEQIALNETHIPQLPEDKRGNVQWTCGDSARLHEVLGVEGATLTEDDLADHVFSCPPYAGLEAYSTDPRDLSNMQYEDFLVGYRSAIQQSCELLKDNRFATFVVGEVRDKRDDDGAYLNFVGDTIKAFQDAGLRYYNEAILITSFGSVGVRIPYSFSTQRKLGKVHQNILTFIKGDAKLAAEACQKGTWAECRAITGEILGKSRAKAIYNPEGW